MKKVCVAASLLMCLNTSHAAGPRTDFAVTVGPAILCRDKLDMQFFYNYLTTSFGPSYKREQGAYWFRAKGQLFGKDVVEIFISDQSTDWIFAGVIFNAKPDELASAVEASVGPIFIKSDKGAQYSAYQSQGESEIMWQGKRAKMLCRHLIGQMSGQ